MELDRSMTPILDSSNHPSPSKQQPLPLRKTSNASYSSPPIMSAPSFGPVKPVSTSQSPLPFYAQIPSTGQTPTLLHEQVQGQEVAAYGFNPPTSMEETAQQFSFQEYSVSKPQQQQPNQNYFQHYNTAPNSRHGSFSYQQQYYQDLPDVMGNALNNVPDLTATTPRTRPKSLAAHDFGADLGITGGGAGQVYNRK
ncbi:hypothetical protein BX616_000908 [Lobosporangium transversale]|nr:hypothetical protein BX616_000908 [Lobosporangium transversale]